MACVTTRSRSLDCRDSIGGISVVYIADYSDKGTPTLSATSGTITAWTDAASDFYTYEVRPETANASFNVTANDANGTVFYTHTITFQLDKLSGYEGVENDILAKGRFLIMYKDRNGKYFVLGYNNGMRLSAMENTTGSAMGDYNGAKLTFTSNEETPAYEVSSGIISGLLA
jgi:hypothetical protein